MKRLNILVSGCGFLAVSQYIVRGSNYYYYTCYCAKIKLIVVQRCDHSGCVDWYSEELITFGGSVFQSLITGGNFHESINVCGWLKYPSLDGADLVKILDSI